MKNIIQWTLLIAVAAVISWVIVFVLLPKDMVL